MRQADTHRAMKKSRFTDSQIIEAIKRAETAWRCRNYAETHMNQVWSKDFMHDQLAEGRSSRCGDRMQYETRGDCCNNAAMESYGRGKPGSPEATSVHKCLDLYVI